MLDASALASSVFPVPGGPYRSTPCAAQTTRKEKKILQHAALIQWLVYRLAASTSFAGSDQQKLIFAPATSKYESKDHFIFDTPKCS